MNIHAYLALNWNDQRRVKMELLAKLKPGDSVFQNQSLGGPVLQKVERVTKTQIVITYLNYFGELVSYKYRLDGSSFDKYNGLDISPVFEGEQDFYKAEEIEKVRRETIIKALKERGFENHRREYYSTGQLERILFILCEGKTRDVLPTDLGEHSGKYSGELNP